MTNDIEAAAEQEALARVVLDKAAVLLDARAMLDARYVSLHKCAEANFRAALDRYARRTAALAHAARGGMETSDISIPCPPGVGLGCHATPPPATGEGFAGLPVAYQSSSIGAPPWDGPATGEADPDPRGEDREAVEAARGEGHGPGKCLPVDAVEADRVVASREQDERERWIRADERERCAKVCDERVEIHAMYRRYDTKDGEAEREAAECAAAIRALRTAERGEGGR